MNWTIGIFVSHSWHYSERYNTLADWIFGGSWITEGPNGHIESIHFIDHSIPRDDPIHSADGQQLAYVINHRIHQSDVVVIPIGMWANCCYWIQKEIDGAVANNKPILAVNPWGQERKPFTVMSKATAAVGWNKKSVIDMIWDLYYSQK